MKGPFALCRGSRGFALGVQPIVNLGNCALMTLRSPLGFQETYFCLMSPESPRLLCRGPCGNSRRGVSVLLLGESVSLVNTADPRWSRCTAFPTQHKAIPHYDATSESTRTIPLNKHSIASIASSETRPQLHMALGIELTPRKRKTAHHRSTLT